MHFILFACVTCLVAYAAAEPSCPPTSDPGTVVHFPHPTDCNKFLSCHWGNLVELSCPNGTFWNDSIKACDFQANVNCSSTTEPATTTEQPATTTTELQTTTTTTEVSSTTVAPAGKCPDQYDPDHQVYLPHEDCTKFYICTWGGVAIEQQCPANLHWNQQLSYCDYPQQAGCTSTSPATTPSPSTTSSSPSPTTTTTELQTTTSTTEVPSTTSPATPSTSTPSPTTTTELPTSTTEVPSTPVTPAGKCPDQYDPNHQVYLPHVDCTKYYICSWGGVAIEQTCPANLHWNQQLSYCDYPQQAGCTSTSPATTPSPSTTSSSPSPTTTTTELQTTTSTTEVPSTTSPATPSTSTPSPTTTTELPTSTTEVPSTPVTPAGKCPDQYDPNHQVYLPHVDCTKYYICSWGGVAIEQKCPTNLHWNQQLSYCDYPQQAGCTSTSPATTPSSTTSASTSSSTTTTTELQTSTSTTEVPSTTSAATPSTSTPSPITTTELPTSTTEVPSTPVTPAGKCPDQYDPNHQVYLPHVDCTKYYICSWGGVAIEQKCPENLHWNQQLSYCDYPQQAGCTSTSPSTSPATTPSSTPISSTSTSASSTASPAPNPATDCPPVYDPNHQVYFPHDDCSKYYICTYEGNKLEQNCPAGLHWSQSHSYCDRPEVAQCTSA